MLATSGSPNGFDSEKSKKSCVSSLNSSDTSPAISGLVTLVILRAAPELEPVIVSPALGSIKVPSSFAV